jgi:hypothetical protein
MTDCNSSIKIMGEKVTQIITFKNGVKKTINGIYSETIKQGQFTKFMTDNGCMVLVNDNNVLMIEVFKEKQK